MALGKFPVPGRHTMWMIVGQGPIALAVGVGWGCSEIFSLPGQSPGRAIVQPPMSVMALALTFKFLR